jgi:FSR family fosmidomycin resistance protein-like MFS transporter
VSLVENIPPPPGEEPAPDASFRVGPILTISAGHAAHDTFVGFVPVLLPSFVERFGLSNTKAGALSAFTQLPSLLQPVFGHLADRLALRWMVTLAPGITATLMSLTGWAPGYAVLALLLTTAGISSAAFHAVASATAGRLSARHLGRGLSLWMVGGELGSAVGPLLAAGALALLTLKGLAWLMILGWAASFALHLQLRRLPPGFGQVERPHWRLALGRMRRVMGIMAALAVLRAMALSAPWTFGPILLQEEGHGNLASGAALTLYLTAGMVGTLGAGWLSDRVGRRVILLFGTVAGPAGLLLFIAAGGWTRFIFLALAGVATVALHPVSMALVQETFPESRGLANALYLSTVFIVSSVAAVAVGALGDALGLRSAFVISGAVTFLSLPLIFLLPRDRRARQGGQADHRGSPPEAVA